METNELLRHITRKEIYDYTTRIREMPRKGYSTKGSRARANETIEINRSELIALLLRCGVLASGCEVYSKRCKRAYRLQFANKFNVSPMLFKVHEYMKKS